MVIAIVCPHQYILCPYIIAFSHVQGSINNNTNQYSICKHIHGIHSCLIERKNTSSWPQPLQPSLSHHLYLTSTPPDGPQVGDYTYDLILICTVSQSCVRDVSTMYFYCRAFKRFYIKKRKPQFRSMCTLSFSSFFFFVANHNRFFLTDTSKLVLSFSNSTGKHIHTCGSEFLAGWGWGTASTAVWDNSNIQNHISACCNTRTHIYILHIRALMLIIGLNKGLSRSCEWDVCVRSYVPLQSPYQLSGNARVITVHTYIQYIQSTIVRCWPTVKRSSFSVLRPRTSTVLRITITVTIHMQS